jgi:hypothetical protein
MPLRQRHLLCLKVQGDSPDLLAISLQPLFSKKASICGVVLSNRVTGCSIDLVQGRWLIACKSEDSVKQNLYKYVGESTSTFASEKGPPLAL